LGKAGNRVLGHDLSVLRGPPRPYPYLVTLTSARKVDPTLREKMRQWTVADNLSGILSDDGMEDTLYDSESVRRFCLGKAAVDEVPDERSIRRFRHLLETEKLQEKLMQRVTRLYRGILKNALHLNTLCMLASLYLKRRVLVAAQG
jgi:hypothetical protein